MLILAYCYKGLTKDVEFKDYNDSESLYKE